MDLAAAKTRATRAELELAVARNKALMAQQVGLGGGFNQRRTHRGGILRRYGHGDILMERLRTG